MSERKIEFAETPWGRFAFERSGPVGGTPLVLLQRFRGTLDDWDPDFIAAVSRDREVIRFDSAGIGRSEGETPVSLEGMADAAIGFIRAMGLQKVDLLGWSLGGFVSQYVTLKAPDLIRRLIIAGSGPGGPSEGPTPSPRVLETMAHPVNGDEDFLFLFFAETPTALAAGRAYLDRRAAVVDAGPPVSAASFRRQLQAIGTAKGVRERLPELTLPVLVANGAHDAMIPAYRSYIISQDAPNAKLVLYPDSGHAFLFQHIDAFAAEISAFLG